MRFIWLRDGSVVHCRFTRTPFGLSSSPALLNTCLDALYSMWESFFPDTVAQLRKSVYCDDFVGSVDYDSTWHDIRIT